MVFKMLVKVSKEAFMKKVRGKQPTFIEHPWETINECAYSSVTWAMHWPKMQAARKNAAEAAMTNLHLYAAYTLEELSQMCENMAYYIVQVETTRKRGK